MADCASRISLEKGSLMQKIRERTRHAMSTGALQSIPTDFEFVEDGGVRFLVRRLSNLVRKDEARKTQAAKSVNPFLPYEEDMFVADVTDTHVALLNKFNVVELHLLIVTRHFEDQTALLTLQDFEALWACMAEYDGLGFYNGGEEAGASQRHKHLQVVPLPLAPEGPHVPVEPLFDAVSIRGNVCTITPFSFKNSFVRFAEDHFPSLTERAAESFNLYRRMLEHVGMTSPGNEGVSIQSGPYCLLVTRQWMFLVPRSCEFFGGVSINSLGFAGALLVRNEEEMERLKKTGPLHILRSVAVPL